MAWRKWDGQLPSCCVPAGTSWRPTGATLLWLHHALAALDSDLQRRFGCGAGIVYRRGPCLQALQSVAEAARAGAVHFSSRYEPAKQARCHGLKLSLWVRAQPCASLVRKALSLGRCTSSAATRRHTVNHLKHLVVSCRNIMVKCRLLGCYIRGSPMNLLCRQAVTSSRIRRGQDGDVGFQRLLPLAADKTCPCTAARAFDFHSVKALDFPAKSQPVLDVRKPFGCYGY